MKMGVLFTFMLCLITACHEPVPPKKGIRIQLAHDPATLDPRSTRSLDTVTILRALYEGLMKTGKEGEFVPALAEEVHVSEDGKTYTYVLREAQWSNGEKVRATDFKNAWLAQIDPKDPKSNASLFYPIVGAKAFRDGTCPMEEVGISTPTENTLVVQLAWPTPYFNHLVASFPFFPYREGAWNGPFTLREWKHSDHILLERNLAYWDAPSVQLDTVEIVIIDEQTAISLFETGELDWIGSPMGTLPQDSIEPLKKEGILGIKEGAGTNFLRVNTTCSALSDPKIRQALSLAIDREAITTHITQGGQTPATHIVPPSFLTIEEPVYQEIASGLVPARLVYTFSSNDRNRKVAAALQQQWKKRLGIELLLEPLEHKVFFDRISKGDYQIAMGSWFADFLDPISFLEVFKYKSNGTNNTGWENQNYVSLLESSQKELNPEKRAVLLREAANILLMDTPAIPMYHSAFNFVKNPKLEGIIFSGLGYLDLKEARLVP